MNEVGGHSARRPIGEKALVGFAEPMAELVIGLRVAKVTLEARRPQAEKADFALAIFNPWSSLRQAPIRRCLPRWRSLTNQ